MLEKLDTKESYFLDLAAEEGWPKDKLREKINSIRDDRKKITRQLEAATNQLETGRQVFLTALDLLDDPHGMYARKPESETVKSILNRAFFTRLYVDGGRVTDQELAEPFNMLHEAYTIYREHQAERRSRGDTPRTYHRRGAANALTGELEAATTDADEAAWRQALQTASSADLPEETGATSRNTLIRLLALALSDAGSSKPVMVGLTGFEPATPFDLTRHPL